MANNLDFLKAWTGSITINDRTYPNYSDIPSNLALSAGTRILLHPKAQEPKIEPSVVSGVYDSNTPIEDGTLYTIRVKKYMTKPATPEFDFMAKWNNNMPMPLRVMIGEKVKETRGMVYMTLHGDILAERTQCCMRCGKPITNPVSQFFGMGPECGGHNYTNPFDTDEELRQAVEQYRQRLNSMVWEGWIIRSAIEELTKVEK